MSYLKRTGTGINDVQWDENIIINDKNSDYAATLSLKKNGSVSELDLKGSGAGLSSPNIILRGIGQPSIDTDATNKKYVDTAVTTAVPAGKFVETTGGTMTGELVLSGKPTQDNGAATKKYVDDALGGAAPAGDYMLKTGDTMTGNLNMSNNQITNVNTMTATNIIVKGTSDASATIKVTGDASRSELDLNDASNNPVVLKGVDTPADNNDAANKQYVDAVDTKVVNLEGEVTGVKNTVANITSGSTELPYLSIAGGTLTGALTLSGDPTSDLQAATKGYIDKRADDETPITITPDSTVTIANYKCFRHNKFLFLNLTFTDSTKYTKTVNKKILTFNIDNSIIPMSFHILELMPIQDSNGNDLGLGVVQLRYTIENNSLYIDAIECTDSRFHNTALKGFILNQMFAFLN